MIVKTVEWLTSRFSITKCKCFASCPRKFWYRYVVKIKEDPSPFLMVGRAVHTGQETDHWAKLRGEKLTTEQVLESAVSSLEEENEKAEIDVSVDEFVNEHRRQLEIYEQSGERAKVNPVPGSIEAAFSLEVQAGDPEHGLKAATIEGFTDVVSQDSVTGDRTVIDMKTAGKPISKQELEDHLQLTLEMMGAEAAQGKIVTFVRHAKQKATTKVSEPVFNTQTKLERVLRFFADTIHAIRRAIKSGDFPKCAPESHWCKPGICTYFERCYGPDPNLHKYITVEKINPVGSLPVPEWRESAAGKKERERTQAK